MQAPIQKKQTESAAARDVLDLISSPRRKSKVSCQALFEKCYTDRELIKVVEVHKTFNVIHPVPNNVFFLSTLEAAVVRAQLQQH